MKRQANYTNVHYTNSVFREIFITCIYKAKDGELCYCKTKFFSIQPSSFFSVLIVTICLQNIITAFVKKRMIHFGINNWCICCFLLFLFSVGLLFTGLGIRLLCSYSKCDNHALKKQRKASLLWCGSFTPVPVYSVKRQVNPPKYQEMGNSDVSHKNYVQYVFTLKFVQYCLKIKLKPNQTFCYIVFKYWQFWRNQ